MAFAFEVVVVFLPDVNWSGQVVVVGHSTSVGVRFVRNYNSLRENRIVAVGTVDSLMTCRHSQQGVSWPSRPVLMA